MVIAQEAARTRRQPARRIRGEAGPDKDKAMFAVVKTGGKQYRVREDDELKVERIAGDPGTIVQMGEVLMAGDRIGTPTLDGASIAAEIVEHGRARKVIAFKKRRRQNSRRKIGHRQHWTLVRISEILLDGASPSKAARGPVARTSTAPSDAGDSADATSASNADADATSVVGNGDTPVDLGAAGAAPATPDEARPEGETTAADLGNGQTFETDEPLFQAPEAEPDKLVKIRGIGPVAERQLNEQGITTFRQIAELSDEDVQRVDDYMPFSSAQIRDWQGQAKKLIED